MDLGLFSPPYAPDYVTGKRTAKQVIEWDLQLATWADTYGLHEIYFAEHHTVGVEPSPAPDLVIAAASQLTERVKLGAAAHLLPFHNPMALATRLLWLDHMTGGRYIAGFAPGSFPTDGQYFGVGVGNTAMMDEAIDIIVAVWAGEAPFRIDGQYWTCDMPAYSEQWKGPHLKPFLGDRGPEVVMTGVQANSPTFIDAGRRGFSPMSQQVANHVLRQQWETFATAAAESGHDPQRRSWRVMRDIFVADTDAEARRQVLDGPAGRTWEEHILPAFRTVRDRGGKSYALGELLIEPGMSIDELTLEWMADHFFLVGSPETVVQKLTALHDDLGGVGAVLSFAFDYSDDPAAYEHHLDLLGREVAPRVASLGRVEQFA